MVCVSLRFCFESIEFNRKFSFLSSFKSESPELSKFHPFLSQSIGSSFTLFCSSMKGSKPLEFVWNKNGLNIKNSIIFDRYQIDSKPSYSLLSIHSLQPNDSGNYSCSVTNPFGYDLQWSLLEIKGLWAHILFFLEFLFVLIPFFFVGEIFNLFCKVIYRTKSQVFY